MENKLVIQNTISFNRISPKYCIGYEILACQNINGEDVTFKLDYIENPKTINPVKDFMYLEYTEDKENLKEWNLPSETIINSANSVKLIINDEVVNTNFYSVSPKYKTIYIDQELKEDDVIKVEYYLDIVVYTHNTTESFEYKIVPIYDKEKIKRNTGQHSILGVKYGL